MLKEERISEDFGGNSPPKLPLNIGGKKWGEKNRKKSEPETIVRNREDSKQKKEDIDKSYFSVDKKKSVDAFFVIDEKEERKDEKKKSQEYVVKTGENSRETKEKVMAYILSQREIYQGEE